MATTERDEALIKGDGLGEHSAPASSASLPVRYGGAPLYDEPLVLTPGAHAGHLKDDVATGGHGLRGWLRMFQIARVLAQALDGFARQAMHQL